MLRRTKLPKNLKLLWIRKGADISVTFRYIQMNNPRSIGRNQNDGVLPELNNQKIKFSNGVLIIDDDTSVFNGVAVYDYLVKIGKGCEFDYKNGIVYFLCDDLQRVVYIGWTANLHHRLSGHDDKDYSMVGFIFGDRNLEYDYQKKFCPKYNKVIGKNHEKNPYFMKEQYMSNIGVLDFCQN